jgi:hypothetical protein
MAVGTGAFVFQDAMNMWMGEACNKFYVSCEGVALILKRTFSGL